MPDQSPNHFADRFLQLSQAKGAAVCVGLDPVLERLPDALDASQPLQAIQSYCFSVIDAVAAYVPCVKPQIACFERYGSAGFDVYEKVVTHAQETGLLVVGDAKRGDIGTSSAHYAAGLLAGSHGSDSLTVNAYLGADGIEPFFNVAKELGKGLFALVRTSNPGGDAIQTLMLTDGRTIAQAVGDVVAELGQQAIGESGYSLLGMVIGATKPEDAAALRERYPQQLFLVPGYGAQGGGVEGAKACFKADGTGAIITASRSVIYAYQDKPDDWTTHVADAAKAMRDEIAQVVG